MRYRSSDNRSRNLSSPSISIERKVTGMDFKKSVKLAAACMLTAVFFAAMGANAYAKDKPKLDLKMKMEKEVTVVKDGKEVSERTPVQKVKPGDLVVHTITYTNLGKGEAKDARLVDKVPNGTDYVVGSAEGSGAEVTCSIDGGKTYAKEPVKIKVKSQDGKTVEKDADPAMYTHVRWVVKSVAPGGSGTVSFKTKVEE